MTLPKLIAVLIVSASSSLAFADPPADNARKWTITAADAYASAGNADKKPVVTAPGVLVTAQRDPQDKR